MLIARNSVVTLRYSVKDSDGNVIDSGAQPLVYLHGGYGGIFDKIEEAIQGKAAGDSLEIKLQPEDAFGEYDAERIFIEARDLFPQDIEVGTQFERADDDERLYTITDITEDKVVVDGNHPLAGIALIFSCTIADVRNATAEEVSHGHVHGAHGHHH